MEAIRVHFNDEVRWIPAGGYNHPEGRQTFPIEGKDRHGFAGPLAECETVESLDDYEWPNPDYLDFSGTLERLDGCGDVYRASGMWTPFYHIMMNLFGMENYLIKMYTHPDVVHAVTTERFGPVMPCMMLT